MRIGQVKCQVQGYTSLILETGYQMTAAIALYKHLGFNSIPNFGPYKDMTESVCMEKNISID